MPQKQTLIKLNDDQLDELSDYLLGSNHTIEEGLSYIELTVEQLDPSSFNDIYATMFRCQWCGWWHDDSDNCGEDCCYQCAIEGKDDEEDDDIFDYADEPLDDGDDN